MAIHLRLCASPKLFQVAANGLRDNCCAGVKSCQAGFDDAFNPFELLAETDGVDTLADEGWGSSGVAATPCANAHEAELLKTAKTQKMATVASFIPPDDTLC